MDAIKDFLCANAQTSAPLKTRKNKQIETTP